MAEVVMCDKCKKVVKRDDTSKFSYRSPESMRDHYNGRTVDLDVCEPCLTELTNWTGRMAELEEGKSNDEG